MPCSASSLPLQLIVILTALNAMVTKSRTVSVRLVANTKVSGSSAWSMRHIPSTYSLAKPQSRFASMLPSSSLSCRPSLILATVSVILRVTNSRPRSGDSWLNKMPLVAKIPYDSR
ncbi:hypothetical protein D9M71_811080 [compost metagenome]